LNALTDIAALYAGNAWLFAGSIFILGLMVGSFLNVVIFRVPLMLERSWRAEAETVLAAGAPPGDCDTRDAAVAGRPAAFNLFTPRSSCTHCQVPIKPWHNIPVLSWLWLRGRCAACQAPISIRYPLVELATAALSAAVAWRFGFDPVCACALGVTWALIALTGIDIDHQLLPDGITLPLMWAGLLASVVIGATGSALPVSPRDAIIGAAAGYLSLWLIYHAFRLATGKEGMGYGDFKLYAALGAWLGWKILPLVILLSAATGAVLGIALILLRGRDRSQPIPFGPYLAAAGWLAMLYGNSLLEGYLRLSGINR
jgi:leader peptidase (prepilin peptidase)/N-methyltransferase